MGRITLLGWLGGVGIICLLSLGVVSGAGAASLPAVRIAHEGLKKLAWQLAIPTGTFGDASVFEAIDRLHEMSVHHLELTPGQVITNSGHVGAVVGTGLSEADVAGLLLKLKSVHMDIVSYGPVELGGDASARDVFSFAKKIKAKEIVTTATGHSLESVGKLAEEYKISVAIQNRAGSSGYAGPDELLAAVATLPARVGSDDDLIEWQKAKVGPIGATHQLRGHIVQVRVGEIAAEPLVGVLEDLKADHFKGVITVVCPPGAGPEQVGRLGDLLNRFSDAVTKVADE
jgi:hypothetical protein